MTKKLLLGAGIVSLIFAFVTVMILMSGSDIAKASTAYALSIFDNTGGNNATTTRNYIGTATSTLISARTDGSSSLVLNLVAEASTTGSVMFYQIEHSQTNAADNTAWFCEDQVSLSTSDFQTTHSNLCPIHKWTPGTVSTTTRQFDIDAGGLGTYTRVRAWSATAALSVFPTFIIQYPNQN